MSASTTVSGFLSAFNRRPAAAGGRACIDSEKSTTAGVPGFPLAAGEVRALPPDRRFVVVSGRVWLTHAGDRRDFFPRPGGVFASGPASVVEGLSAAVLRTL